MSKYRGQFGDGIVLPNSHTKLRFSYHPASATLAQGGELRLDIGGLPDVTAVTGPIKKIKELAEQVTAELESYSRFLGRNPDAQGSLEALLQLPASLWPDGARA